MAVKTKEGKDLVLLQLNLKWGDPPQPGLRLSFSPPTIAVTMAIQHVDDLIAELIGIRDVMAEQKERSK